ncbi:hypothetical protein Bca4012_052299 [Brassica carinata]
MEVKLLSSVFGLSPVSSERVVGNAVLPISKSNPRRQTNRVTAINSVASKTHVGVQRIIKYENGAATIAKVVENPYLKAETASPDLHKSLLDFLEEARDFVGDDDGPPRWVFDVWCLHIPVRDRTPAKDLVKLIERTVRSEKYRFPNRPIYLVGESIGACLALDVAARNPDIDLLLILANLATHVNYFMSQPLVGMLNVLPDGVPTLLEEIFGFKHGDPLTGMIDALMNELAVHQMSGVGGWILKDLFAISTHLPTLSRLFPKDTLLWKVELLKSAVTSANAHIYAVRAETLILLSGRDQWLLKEEDINRYSITLPKCIVRKLKDNGHFLFFEEGVDLVNIIKCTNLYRRGKSHDHLSDYIMPTRYELKKQLDDHKLLIDATSPVYLSTLEDGKIVRGFEGLPSEGPVLYVGYHMLLGLELGPMITQVLKERNIHLRGHKGHDDLTSSSPSSGLSPAVCSGHAPPVSALSRHPLFQEDSRMSSPGGILNALATALHGRYAQRLVSIAYGQDYWGI